MRIKRLFLVLGLASFGLLIALWGISVPSSAVAGMAAQADLAASDSEPRVIEGLSPLPTANWQDDGIGLTDFFGQATAVSDFDYDGNPDYVVGAPLYNNGQGAVFVYVTNGAPYPNVNSPLIITAPTGALEFGHDVYMNEEYVSSQILIGAPGYDNGRGAMYVYDVTVGASLSATEQTKIFGLNAGERFGETVALFDFVDSGGTSVEAVVIGAPLSPDDSGGSAAVGRVDVFTKTTNWVSLGTSLQWRVYGDNADSGFGRAIETSYRLNAPDTLYVGAPQRDSSGESDNGAVFIYELDDSTPPNWNLLADKVIEGDQSGANFGHSLFAADFNHDGAYDIAIGQPFYVNANNAMAGRVFIETDYANATRLAVIDDIILEGFDDGGQFGYALGFGYLSQSGCGDLLVGAPGHTFTQQNEGAVFAYGNHPVPVGDPCGAIKEDPFTLFAGNTPTTYLGTDISFVMTVGNTAREVASSSESAFLFGVPHANADQGTVLAYAGNQTETVISNVLLTATTKVATNEAANFVAVASSGGHHIFWWDMGDGTEYLSSNDSAPMVSGGSHVYEKSGEYSVTLRAMSVNGPVQVLHHVIKVVDPISGFSMDADIADAGQETVFTATVQSSGDPFTLRVLFGDENVLADERIIDPATYFRDLQAGVFTFTHVYSPAGIYQVRVQAYNDIDKVSASKYIRVRAFKPLVPGVGGTLSTDITGTQRIEMKVPGAAIGENVTLRVTPIEDGCGGIDAPANSLGLCFDIDVTSDDGDAVRTTADRLSHATTSSCIYLPFMTSNGTSNGTGGTAATSAACSSLGDTVYQFLTGVTITMQYDDSLIPNRVAEEDLIFRYYSPSAGAWRDGASTCTPASKYVRDTANNTISVQICHQSRWAFGR